MKSQSNLMWDGIIKLSVLSMAGKLLRESVVHNSATNYARSAMAIILSGSAPIPLILPGYAQLGTGTGTPSLTDTDLWIPDAGTLKQCSTIQPYLSYYTQYITTWLTTDPIQGAWTEVGLKDIGGNLWAHAAMASLPVYAGEVLVAQWSVQILGN